VRINITGTAYVEGSTFAVIDSFELRLQRHEGSEQVRTKCRTEFEQERDTCIWRIRE
jgi:hypothetical protein